MRDALMFNYGNLSLKSLGVKTTQNGFDVLSLHLLLCCNYDI